MLTGNPPNFEVQGVTFSFKGYRVFTTGVSSKIANTCHGQQSVLPGLSKISSQLPEASKVMLVFSDVTSFWEASNST
ncbi:hypothetical protein Tco_0462681 [Tanacetum coccineum]